MFAKSVPVHSLFNQAHLPSTTSYAKYRKKFLKSKLLENVALLLQAVKVETRKVKL